MCFFPRSLNFLRSFPRISFSRLLFFLLSVQFVQRLIPLHVLAEENYRQEEKMEGGLFCLVQILIRFLLFCFPSVHPFFSPFTHEQRKTGKKVGSWEGKGKPFILSSFVRESLSVSILFLQPDCSPRQVYYY